MSMAIIYFLGDSQSLVNFLIFHQMLQHNVTIEMLQDSVIKLTNC